MSFALPQSLRDYIDRRVESGHYGNTSEYLRELVRRDQQDEAGRRLRNLVGEGLASGPGRDVTNDVVVELRDRAFRSEP